MSGFIAPADPAVAGQPDVPEKGTAIANDGWFPDIELGALREAVRIDGTVSTERLRAAALDAMVEINRELDGWRRMQISDGRESLEAVPAAALGGVSTHVLRYQRAVYHQTRAVLTEQYRALDTTKTGGQQAEDLASTIADSWRNVRWALNGIRGLRHSTVELI